MTAFDANWLALREALDRQARATSLTRLLQRAFSGEGRRSVVDLGCGTGSNLRYLAPKLGGEQAWRLLDTDPTHLANAPPQLAAWATAAGYNAQQEGKSLRIQGAGFTVAAAFEQVDLATALPISHADLVTGSALLDLVSHGWLEKLVAASANAGAAALFVLSYDGRIDWSPRDAADELLRRSVNTHQRGDKGFGPALGPDAAESAAGLYESAGYDVITAPSDWHLDASAARCQQYLHAGWAAAARETAPGHAAAIDEWLTRRMDLLMAGSAKVSVGHTDLLALPAL